MSKRLFEKYTKCSMCRRRYGYDKPFRDTGFCPICNPTQMNYKSRKRMHERLPKVSLQN